MPMAKALRIYPSTSEERLRGALPAAANIHNPVDVLGDARADRYGTALEVVVADPGVDGVIVIVTPQTATDIEGTAEAVVRVSREAHKPVLGCWMGEKEASRGTRILSAKSPIYLLSDARPWLRGSKKNPCRACVAAIDFSGTCAAAILEEYPEET